MTQHIYVPVHLARMSAMLSSFKKVTQFWQIMSKKKLSKAATKSKPDKLHRHHGRWGKPPHPSTFSHLPARALFSRQPFPVFLAALWNWHFKLGQPSRHIYYWWLFVYLDKDGDRSTVFKCDDLVSQCALHDVSSPTAGLKAQYLHLGKCLFTLGPVSGLLFSDYDHTIVYLNSWLGI